MGAVWLIVSCSGSEFSWSSLPSPAVLGLVDPCDDGEPSLLPSGAWGEKSEIRTDSP